jgi:tetratricopeptide (TPR) repeat protein
MDSGRRQRLSKEAEAAAQTAVRLAPELGDAWLASALSALTARNSVGTHEVTDTEIAGMFQRAIELSPNHALAHKYYANFCSDPETLISCERDYLSLLMKAAQLDPRSGIIKVNIGEHMEEAGRDEEAERWYRESLTTNEPFFRLGNYGLSWFQLYRGKPAEVALRNRSQFRQWPGEYVSFIFWLTALMDLGAWNEASAAIETTMTKTRDVPLDYDHRGLPLSWEHLNTLFQHRVARVTGRWETAEALARQQLAYYEEHAPSWPQLQFFMSPQAVATIALVEVREGRAELALARVEAAYPDPSVFFPEPAAPDPLHPLWMQAALLKQVGQAPRAEQMLRRYLAFLDAEEDSGEYIRVGWSRFMAWALLGERQAALNELERIAGTPNHHRWYDLETWSFDPDYAEVLGDPRFVAAFDRIKARADRMREEYLGSE